MVRRAGAGARRRRAQMWEPSAEVRRRLGGWVREARGDMVMERAGMMTWSRVWGTCNAPEVQGWGKRM